MSAPDPNTFGRGKYSKVIRTQHDAIKALVSCTDRALAERDAEIKRLRDGLDLIEGGLVLLQMAARAGDPMSEICWRIDEELRQVRSLVGTLAVTSTEQGGA